VSDLANKPEPNLAPFYCGAMYPEIAKITRAHGYALAVHGSMVRDFDLIAIPWVDDAADPKTVVDAIVRRFDAKLVAEEGHVHPHGRLVWNIYVGFGHCYIDLGFMPRLNDETVHS
jgi:hypothetical protein